MKGVAVLLAGVLLGMGGMMIYHSGLGVKERNIEPPVQIERPLLGYTIENLGMREYKSEIFLDEAVATTSAYTVYNFHFNSDGKNVTGLAHIPGGCGRCPVIVQFRGYAVPEKYYQGYGTKHSSELLAASGFISLAPDFLGYGGSASPSADVFEARFETYTTALNLLEATSHWPLADSQEIGIWGHSNGGQIALTILEISQKDYPTVLWAPVSSGFPYSILYYMNENETGDRELRSKLYEFEKLYDSGQFNLLNYLSKITAPIEIHQGTADESVPVSWSRSLVRVLGGLKKEVKYYEYPGADHNLVGDWDPVVRRTMEFYRLKFGLTEK
jgi:dipeptidyl aminopeptidase/acylaminoacyl peptidase